MDHPDLTAFAARFRVCFERPQRGEDMMALVSRMMSGLAVGCVNAGVALIGHIKCVGEGERGGHVACSVVTHDGKPDCKGELPDGSKGLLVVLNVLVYGLDEAEVKEIFRTMVERELQGGVARFDMDPPGRGLVTIGTGTRAVCSKE